MSLTTSARSTSHDWQKTGCCSTTPSTTSVSREEERSGRRLCIGIRLLSQSMASAKAGVHVVQLKPIVVSDLLRDGYKFIRWDDVSLSESAPFSPLM